MKGPLAFATLLALGCLATPALADSVTINNITYTCTNACVVTTNGSSYTVRDCCGGRVTVRFDKIEE